MKLENRIILGFILVSALIFISLAVSAASYGFWYADNGFVIEIYSGGKWQPWDGVILYHDGWYYWHYPYRIYYLGNWYYYESGWYQYYDAWYSTPYYGYYVYYPANYVYVSGVWQYSPSWYYNPVYWDNFGWPYYSFFWPASASAVSSIYRQEAKCNELTIEVKDVRVEKGKSAVMYAKLKNKSKYNFTIISSDVYVTGFDISAEASGAGKIIKAKSEGKIAIKITARKSAKNGIVNAALQLTGQFADGKYCNTSNLGQAKFKIYIYAPSSDFSKAEEWQQYGGTGYSYNYYIPKNSNQNEPNNIATANKVNKANENSTNSSANFSAYVPSCNALDVVTENITVKAGESSFKIFIFKNFNSQKFYFDSVEVIEQSDDFSAEANALNSYAFENGTVGIKVRAFGNEKAANSYGTAYLKVKGHFENGYPCELQKEFFIYVSGSITKETEKFSLEVPNKIKLEGSAGFVVFSFENSLEKKVVLTIEGYNLDVTPKKIEIPAMSKGQRIIEISNFNENTGIVLYKSSNIVDFLAKSTVVEKVALEMKPTDDENLQTNLQLVSYTMEIVLKGDANITFTMKNSSNKDVEISAKVSGLPETIKTTTIKEVLKAGETKTFVIPLSTELEEGNYTAKLEISADGQKIERKITINIKKIENKEAAGKNPFTTILGTAFIVITENAVNIAIVLIILAVVYALYRLLIETIEKRRKKEPWAKI